MKKSKKIFLTSLFVGLAFILHLETAQIKAHADSGDVFEKIDSYLSDASAKAHFQSMSITIVDKENVLFSETYGNCTSADTPYLLGSVSKSFTALCIMQLVEQGKIDLDANIEEYLPNSTDGNRITVRQLLNHTGGLGKHQNLENYGIVGKQGVHTYANVNYSLLGKIIEAVSNKSYESYVTENVFEPLGMSNSAATLEKSLENGLTTGYENWFGFNKKQNIAIPNPTAIGSPFPQVICQLQQTTSASTFRCI